MKQRFSTERKGRAESYPVLRIASMGCRRLQIGFLLVGALVASVAGAQTPAVQKGNGPPMLTVTKVVVNDDGGTKIVGDFPLFVDGGSVTSGAANSFSAGAHTVSETTDPGYSAFIGGDCAADGTITLAPGDVKTCTITNDDIVTVPPTFSKSFAPDTIGPGSVSTLTFTITNGEASPVTELAFTDTLPGGVTVADPANASSTCGGPPGFPPTLTAPAGGGTITFADGTLGGSSSCTVSV